MNLSKSSSATVAAYNKGYRVDEVGNVFGPTGKIRKLFIKKDKTNDREYYTFNVRYEKMSMPIRVHKLQAYQKFGLDAFKQDIVVRHMNGNSLDNSEKNINIGTQSDNMMDKPEHVRRRQAIHAVSMRKLCQTKAILHSGQQY